ncbi:MAG: hypothetical protein JSV58_03365 [Candidatus Bathyarchaeota archaeon]|nr:MAG: hypothetical protein JSV58_03365 [Candidatus Bathyarchaeota archaeon]
MLVFVRNLIDQGVDTFSQLLQIVTYASLSISGGLVMLSSFSLLGTISGSRDSAAWHLARRASKDPARNFFAGFFTTAYLNLVRPPLTVNVLFLPYLEWIVVALAVYAVYSMTRLPTDEFYAGSETMDWKRHVQGIRRETGRDLSLLTSVMEEFVDSGVKEPLLVYLALYLQRLGAIEERILKILSPLVDYRKRTGEQKLLFMLFPWAKRRFIMRNREIRETLLINILERMSGL